MTKVDFFLGSTAVLQLVTALLMAALAFRAIAYMDNTTAARVSWDQSNTAQAAFRAQIQGDIKVICQSLKGDEECGSH